MPNKYRAKRTWSNLCQRWFASKMEAQRGEELAMLENAGKIFDLGFQVTFVLCEKPKVTITIDFDYLEYHGEDLYPLLVYEDTKGVLTRDFRTKLAWLKEKYGIEVKLTGSTRG